MTQPPVRWVASDDALAEVIGTPGGRARLRRRHRVPPRAHLLPEGRAACSSPGRRPASRSSIRSPSTSSRCAALLDGDATGRAARRPAGPRGAAPRLRHGAPRTCSTPSSPPASSATARPSLTNLLVVRALDPPAQGRPPHRLAASGRSRTSSARTPRPTSPTCSSCATSSSPSSRRSVGSSGPSTSARSCGTRPVGPPDPSRAWLRIKDHRHLRGASRGVAQEVAAWRERRAAVARSAGALRAPRPRDPRHRPAPAVRSRRPAPGARARRAGAEEAARRRAPRTRSQSARPLPSEEITQADTEEIPRDLRPAVTLVSAWVSQLARDLHIDTTLLATRSDLVDLLVDADRRALASRLAGRARRRSDPPPRRRRSRARVRRRGRVAARAALRVHGPTADAHGSDGEDDRLIG